MKVNSVLCTAKYLIMYKTIKSEGNLEANEKEKVLPDTYVASKSTSSKNKGQHQQEKNLKITTRK